MISQMRKTIGALGVFALVIISVFAQASTKQAKIVGGTEATKGEFPYIVSLQKASFTSSSHFCGGSLVRPNWVLTAAHCAKAVSASSIRVKIGLHGLKDTSGVETFKVSKMIIHPKYGTGTDSDYDMALLKLSSSSKRALVALNRTEISIGENENTAPLVTTAGWGTTSESGSIASRLRKVTIPLASKTRCSAAYPRAITSRMICAGNARGGKDSCQGDSGGPLIIKENNGEVRLVGVVSWGEGCARPKKYGVYAKVNSMATWVDQTLGAK